MDQFVNKNVYFLVYFSIINCMLLIGETLRDLRKKKGLSLRALDKKVNISFNTLSAYERNVVQPTLENCYNLSKFFEVPIEYFVLADKSKKEFNDIELLNLFNEVDLLDEEDRVVIKKYIKKYMKTKAELESLKEESE